MCSTNDSVSSLVWLSPMGEELRNEGRITVEDIMMEGGVTTRTLTFTPLEVSDSGEYTCQSDTNSSSTTIQLEGKYNPI